MLLRVLSDIHGNEAALRAVLGDPEGQSAERTACLGDIVGYGARPSECLRMMRPVCSDVIQGNHDSGATGKTDRDWFNPDGASAIGYTASVLGRAQLDWLGTLPLIQQMDGLLLCHAYPPDPGGWRYILSSRDAAGCTRAFPDWRMLVGHTHVPVLWDSVGKWHDTASGILSTGCILNVGSVGQPRDGDPRAAYLMIDTSDWSFRHVRVEYDIDETAAAIRAAGLPQNLWRRLYEGR